MSEVNRFFFAVQLCLDCGRTFDFGTAPFFSTYSNDEKKSKTELIMLCRCDVFAFFVSDSVDMVWRTS